MALIHILDKQSDKIIGTLNLGEYSDSGSNEGKVSSSENENTFDFTALKKFDLLQKRNRLLLQDRDGFFSEYIIIYAEQNSRNQKFIKSNATFTDLQKAKIIEPQVLQGATADTATTKALEGTEWKKGKVDYNGIRTLKIEEYTNPYNLLKTIASEFGLDLRFRVAVEGNKIVRYVDLTLPDDEFDGKEVVFGKDLIGLRRIEDAQNIVTALLVLGPEREDGTRLTVLVEDNDALQRWGRNGQHLIEVYEPQITAEEVTVERLRTLGQNALQKRIDAIVTYECQAAILEHIPGKEHEKVRLDMTIRIKDDGYTPPLYLEAKVLEVKEQPSTGKILDFKLGNYKEFSKADLEAQIAGLKKLLAQKASNAKLVETYELALKQAEEKAAQAEENAKGYTDTVKVEVVEHANTVANQAENNAKEHADTVAGEAESNAKAYALSEADKARIAAIQAAATDAQTKVNAAKTALEADIAMKVDAEWVNGQLVLKENAITKSNTAPSNPTVGQLWLDTSVTPNILKRWSGTEWVKATPTSAGEVGAYTKTEVDNALNSKVSTTTYTTDKAGIVNRLDNAESRITQTEKDITSKVSQTTFTQELSKKENSVTKSNTAPTSPTTNQLWLDTSVTPNILKRWSGTEWVKATPTTAAEVGAYTKSETDTKLGGKADTSAVTALETRMSTAETGIQQTASAIELKANKTDVYTKTEVNNALANKADNTRVATVESRVTTAEASIKTQADAIALRALKTDVYTKTEIDGQFNTVNQQISQLDAELSVQADQIATKVSRTEFDSLQIGGRNLLRNTSNPTNSNHLVAGANSYSSIYNDPEKGNVFERSTTSESETFIYSSRTTKVEKSSEYTFSCDVWVNENVKNIDLFWLSDTEDSPKTGTGYTNVTSKMGLSPTPNIWQRITWTFTTKPNDFTGYIRIDNNGSKVSGQNAILRVTNLKLEKGNKATDWTPAPEDVQGQIDGLGTRVNSAETSITQLSNQIALKANQSTVDTLANRISSAESTLTIHTDQIASKVSQTTFESALSGKENTVYKQNTAPAHANERLWLDTSKTPNVLYRSNGSAWIKVTPTLAGEVGAFSQADGNTLAGRLSTAESTITQQADLISQKVSKTDYNGNTIASLINQTATTIKIQASKINLVGAVTVLSDITGNLGNITAGTIRGVNIIGSTFTAVGSNNASVNIDSNGWYVKDETGKVKICVTTKETDFAVRQPSAIQFFNLAGYRAGYVGMYSEQDVMSLYSGTRLIITAPEIEIYGYKITFDGDGGKFRILANNIQSAVWWDNNVVCGWSYWSSAWWRFNWDAKSFEATNYAGTAYMPITASGWNTSSKAELKTDIKKWEESALEKIRNTTIYEYRLKEDESRTIRQGVVIGEGYQLDPSLVDKDETIDQYRMNSWSFKAIQELDSEQQGIKDRVAWLETENSYLKQKIKLLEEKIA